MPTRLKSANKVPLDGPFHLSKKTTRTTVSDVLCSAVWGERGGRPGREHHAGA
jgi:hypothetical protein